MAKIGTDISVAAEFLQTGVIGIPTETVYGLAGNALSIDRVTEIFEVKNRPVFDPLIVHVASVDAALDLVKEIPEKLRILAEHFWPGPLTLLLEKKDVIPDLVTSGLSRVAIRVPAHPLTLELLRSIPFPLAAPSANPFGYISPTTAYHVNDQLGEKIPYILDGGPSAVGLESTIIGLENNRPHIYRLGGLPAESIFNIIGECSIKQSSANPAAPGMLDSHYSPRKPLFIGDVNELIRNHAGKSILILGFGQVVINNPEIKVLNLSTSGNINEAAANLFKMMRLADANPEEIIIADLLPEVGLGRAINDRLKRAAIK
ncbi:MAG: L-threonylcarbamoyladenylate synthase [Bacteroidia bacterium]